MNKKILQQLDYYRIRDEIAQLCVSEEGKEAILHREPIRDEEEGKRLRVLGEQWFLLHHAVKACALHGWGKIADLFSIIKVEGSSLDEKQAFCLKEFCAAARDIKTGAEEAKSEVKILDLALVLDSIPDLQAVEKEISRVIDDSGEMKDLPEIRSIRSKIASLKKEIDGEIRSYTTDPKYTNALQSSLPVLRGGHQVLAVRSDRRGAIRGIIHEMSQSGQTVFIEPEEAVQKSNELLQEEFHLQQEIRRIMTDLTAKLRENLHLFRRALPIMRLLDECQAAARYAAQCRGIFAQNCHEGEAPVLLQARHPILQEKAVPIDVRFLSGKNVLIITGPNTGGKTVTLKTIALFSLLNQSGFPVPAAEGTKLRVFDSVFADIGDEQSIDESLSTFSSHMKNIAAALNSATEKSLVLLDELGSGTDHEEGSAIAMAILDELIEKKSFVLVTTHYGILKNYGYTHSECVNASVDFDEDTLCPTYRILMGVPGESRALDIAKRSGLPKKITQKALSYMQSEQADVSRLIRGLTEKSAELSEMEKEARKKEGALLSKQRRLEERDLFFRERELEIKTREHNAESAFLIETRKMLENLVRSLREGEITREKTLGVKSFISELEERIERDSKSLKAEEERLEESRAKTAMQKIAENGFRITSDSKNHSASKKKSAGGKKRLSNAEALEELKEKDGGAVVIDIPRAIQEKKVEQKQPEWTLGQTVFMGKDRRRGTLIRKEKNGVWAVQFGAVRMSVKEKNLILAPILEQRSNETSVVIEKSELSGYDEKPAFELRLLGLRYEEAMKALEKQLDLCAMTNFKAFSIIHGKGNGILQQGVLQYLSNYPGVADFHFAPPEDGGSGKTYVKLL